MRFFKDFDLFQVNILDQMKHVTLPTDYCVLHANLRSGGGSRSSSDGVERWEDPLVATSIGLEHSNTRNTTRSEIALPE